MRQFAARAAVGFVTAAVVLAGCTSGSKKAGSSSPPGSTAPTGSVSSSAPASAPASAPSGLAAQLQNAYVDVVHRVLPSVVEITTSQGLGSGIVFDTKGDIVTNAHVVGSATSFDVRLSSGAAPLKATLVGTYPPDDLAVIKVSNAKGLQAASFADSSKVRVGDIVLAMGNPLGLSSSVTDGIVSAVGRTVTEPKDANSPGATLPDVIQTSAAINPGNSGGALVDLNAQVVGIPTLAAQDAQMGGAAPGIGFAIPSNVVKDIAKQLVDNGKVVNSHRAALGVGIVTVTGPDGNPAGAGVVSVTSGGPAAAAGIVAGDIITAVNGTDTPTAEALSVVLAGLKPGDKATVSITKQDGSTAKVTVTLGQLTGS
jgi:S1-C subfamily serine protease